MSILHKFSELDHLVLTVPAENGRCSLCYFSGNSWGCTIRLFNEECDVAMEEEDGTDFYVFKELVVR